MKPEEILALVGAAIGRHQKEVDARLTDQGGRLAALSELLEGTRQHVHISAGLAPRLDAIEGRLDTMLEDARAADEDLETRLATLESVPRPRDGRDGRDGVSMAFCGKWEGEKEYRRGDIVAWQGCSWGCLKQTEAGQEPGESDAWEVIALRGNRGKPGERGMPGEQGPPGPIGRLVAAGIEDSALILADETGERYAVDLSLMIQAIGVAVEREFEARLEPIETALRKGLML